jgi:hypothetical protein
VVGSVLLVKACRGVQIRETTLAMLARVTATLDERIGHALAVAAHLLRERRDSQAVDGREAL